MRDGLRRGSRAGTAADRRDSRERNIPPMRILLIEDDREYALLVEEALREIPTVSFEVVHVDRLANALGRLQEEIFGIVLLDLSLPDASGLDTFRAIASQAPETPVVILTGIADERIALQAIQEGAQDYLVKAAVGSDVLVRSIRYSIERHRLLARIRETSVRDTVTGLQNRAGFTVLAEQQLKLADRNHKELVLLLLRTDGHGTGRGEGGEGDSAVRRLAEVLQETFRRSDVLGRIEPDLFAVLAIDAPLSSMQAVLPRLRRNLAALHDELGQASTLVVNVGLARYDPAEPSGQDVLFRAAEKDLAADRVPEGPAGGAVSRRLHLP